MFRRAAAAIVAVILTLALAAPAFAGDGVIYALRVNPYGGGAFDPDTVVCSEIGGEYYAFLPADADLSALTVYVSASDDVFAAGRRLTDGETTDALSAGGRLALTCGDSTFILNVMRGADVPALFITTESGSLDEIHRDKNHKESGTLTLRDGGEAVTLDLEHIKGRGNSTWGVKKKPYGVKLSKKYDLLGLGKAKKWVLLASYYDRSFMRNSAALALARELGVEFTTDCRYVDLWANGEYLGLYQLCEKVEVGTNRVEIADLKKANEAANPGVDPSEAPRVSEGAGYPGARKWVELENDPEDISGGYLLEADYQSRYDAEPGGFESPAGVNVTVSEPEYPTKAQLDYIADFYAEAEEAICSESGFNSAGRHYTEYVDLDSFARAYIINEYTKNIDGGQTSFFMYKEAGDSKLCAAPAWDFDLSMGNFNVKVGLKTQDPKQWYNNILYYSEGDAGTELQATADTILTSLWRHSAAFREAARRCWGELREIATDGAIEALADEARALAPSALMNARRWGISEGKSDERALRSFSREIDAVVEFMTKRRDALDTAFSPDGAMLLYDLGEASGRVLDGTMYAAGDRATVRGVGSPDKEIKGENGLLFAGWNTKPDGTGQPYRQGDAIILARGVTTLYAQWRPDGDPAIDWAEPWRSGTAVVRAKGDAAAALTLYETLRQSALSAKRTLEAWAISAFAQ